MRARLLNGGGRLVPRTALHSAGQIEAVEAPWTIQSNLGMIISEID